MIPAERRFPRIVPTIRRPDFSRGSRPFLAPWVLGAHKASRTIASPTSPGRGTSHGVALLLQCPVGAGWRWRSIPLVLGPRRPAPVLRVIPRDRPNLSGGPGPYRPGQWALRV